MKRFDLVQISTLIANIGVMAGVAFVAVELNQTRSAVVAATYQDRAVSQIETNLTIVTSDELTSLVARLPSLVDGLADLSEEQRVRVILFLNNIMVDADNEHYQYQQGLLDEEFLETSTEGMIRTFAPLWRAAGIVENRAEFKAFVDEVLAE